MSYNYLYQAVQLGIRRKARRQRGDAVDMARGREWPRVPHLGEEGRVVPCLALSKNGESTTVRAALGSGAAVVNIGSG